MKWADFRCEPKSIIVGKNVLMCDIRCDIDKDKDSIVSHSSLRVLFKLKLIKLHFSVHLVVSYNQTLGNKP